MMSAATAIAATEEYWSSNVQAKAMQIHCPGCGSRDFRWRPGFVHAQCTRCPNIFMRPDMDAP